MLSKNELRREMTEEEKRVRKEKMKTIVELTNQNLCPTCYNQKYGGIYEEIGERFLWEDEVCTCFLEQYPITPGHTILLMKNHYEDISQMPLEISHSIMKVIKAVVIALKEGIPAEKVYLCTMCDGKKNHLHFQLIPRTENKVTGRKLFIQPRGMLLNNQEKINKIRKQIEKNLKGDIEK